MSEEFKFGDLVRHKASGEKGVIRQLMRDGLEIYVSWRSDCEDWTHPVCLEKIDPGEMTFQANLSEEEMNFLMQRAQDGVIQRYHQDSLQPIATAPRGEWVLLFTADKHWTKSAPIHCRVGKYTPPYWFNALGGSITFEPTHWMPLPKLEEE